MLNQFWKQKYISIYIVPIVMYQQGAHLIQQAAFLDDWIWNIAMVYWLNMTAIWCYSNYMNIIKQKYSEFRILFLKKVYTFTG